MFARRAVGDFFMDHFPDAVEVTSSSPVGSEVAADDISSEHVSEAIQYRTFDRTLWI
jgi:hypothetical protein